MKNLIFNLIFKINFLSVYFRNYRTYRLWSNHKSLNEITKALNEITKNDISIQEKIIIEVDKEKKDELIKIHELFVKSINFIEKLKEQIELNLEFESITIEPQKNIENNMEWLVEMIKTKGLNTSDIKTSSNSDIYYKVMSVSKT